jgi:hypothetical protein
MVLRSAVVVLIALTLDSASGVNCERVWKKTKPVKTSGVVCGSVFSAASSDSLPGAVLVLRNSAGVAVAKTQADPNGRFQFPAVPKGQYRVESPPFHTPYDQLQVTNSEPARCREAVAVYLDLGAGCGFSWLSKSWPRPY